MLGVLRTRSLACRMEEAYEHSHHRFAEITPALPAQWVYGLLRALPGVSGLLATVVSANRIAQLDPSVEGTGPHGLTVRRSRHSSFDTTASIASRATCRDDRDTPSG